MKVWAFIPIIASICCSRLAGQIQSINIKGSYSDFFQINPNKYNYNILGSPYLNPQWMFGSMTLSDGTNLKTLFRYNVFNQEIEMIYNSDTLGVKASFSIKELVLSNKKFKYSLCIEREFNKDYLTSSLFEVLYEGHYQLLLKHYVEIENNSYSVNYMGGGGDGRDYYRTKSLYYYKSDPGGAARKLKCQKKEICRIFADKKEEIKYFIRKERINLNSAKGLIRIFEYYDTLSL